MNGGLPMKMMKLADPKASADGRLVTLQPGPPW
jgi:hypothetical protein